MKVFVTRAAALVLVWALCSSSAIWSVGSLIAPMYELLVGKSDIDYSVLTAIPSAVCFALPLSGWLADTHFGNFKAFRAGSVLLFLGSVLMCVCVLLATSFNNQASFLASIVIGPISHLLSFSGGSACFVTVFQLGLDQMPDASSTTITNYITSYVMAFSVGFWLCDSLFTILTDCVENSVQSSGLLPAFFMCIILLSLFLFGEKWLIIEPNSPQSLKIIYRVLKFAAKHKAPLNRSALTYWEEDIPSRLDLGKSRYGGPFTTEQVEDVKTFMRLLLLLLPIWFVVFSDSLFGRLEVGVFVNLVLSEIQWSSCTGSIFKSFTFNMWWCFMVTMFVYKVCVYPCFKYKLPSILKRLGFYLFLLTLFSIVYAILNYFFFMSVWPHFAHSCLYGILLSLVITSSIEFVCAQSPYSMRGLLSGLNFVMMFIAIFAGLNIHRITHVIKKHFILMYFIGGGLGIVGFLLFLVVAGCYKRRVRDEEYIPQTHIEAIYDRYLTQAQKSPTCYMSSSSS